MNQVSYVNLSLVCMLGGGNERRNGWERLTAKLSGGLNMIFVLVSITIHFPHFQILNLIASHGTGWTQKRNKRLGHEDSSVNPDLFINDAKVSISLGSL